MRMYDELGVRPFINAGGWMFTRYGGSIMPEPVVAAMAEASKQFVNLFDLQDRMGNAIAAMTHNEAAFVSCGAAAGILLAVAACIAGTDAELADRLPDTQGMRNQVIMARCARGTEADAVVRGAGGRIIQIGPPDKEPGAEEYLGAINDQTAAILLIGFGSEGELRAAPIVKGAHDRGVPVLVDGACSIPPKENLWRYTRDLGVDAFITSGGKAMRGPQSSGLVLGKRAIIEGCKFHASPNLRIGRGMKVGKEEFAGIFAALKLFLATDFDAETARETRQIACIVAALKDIEHITLTVHEGTHLQIKFNPARLGITAEAAAKSLLNSDPSILLRGRDNKLTVNAKLLQEGEELVVADRLRQILTKKGPTAV
jgi:D-glucosaminate-6-phosphate ammonia-lyase